MKAKSVFLLTTTVLLAACSSRTYVTSSAYVGKIIPNMVLLIPNLNHCNIIDRNHLFNEEEKVKVENDCLKQFNSNFAEAVQDNSNFRKVYSVKMIVDQKSEKKILPINDNESITLELPQEPIKLETTEDTYILYLENFDIAIFKESVDTSDPAKHYNVSEISPDNPVLQNAKFLDQFFSITFTYAVYENNSMELICYGKINVKDKMKKGVNFEKTLVKTFDKIAAKILKETPFEK